MESKSWWRTSIKGNEQENRSCLPESKMHETDMIKEMQLVMGSSRTW